jgi:hypothetical protein
MYSSQVFVALVYETHLVVVDCVAEINTPLTPAQQVH